MGWAGGGPRSAQEILCPPRTVEPSVWLPSIPGSPEEMGVPLTGRGTFISSIATSNRSSRTHMGGSQQWHL